jgi:hypothetical protein
MPVPKSVTDPLAAVAIADPAAPPPEEPKPPRRPLVSPKAAAESAPKLPEPGPPANPGRRFRVTAMKRIFINGAPRIFKLSEVIDEAGYGPDFIELCRKAEVPLEEIKE